VVITHNTEYLVPVKKLFPILTSIKNKQDTIYNEFEMLN